MTETPSTIRELALSASPPWLIASATAIADVRSVSDLDVKRFDGQQMGSTNDLLRHIYEVVGAPEWSGMNWNALYDTLRGREWARPERPILLIIQRSEALLSDASVDEFVRFMKVLVDAGERASRPRVLSFTETVPPTPFHTLFVVSPSDNAGSVINRLGSVGFEIALL